MEKQNNSPEFLDSAMQIRIWGAKSQGFNQYLAQLNGAAHNLNRVPEKAEDLAQIIAAGYYLILEKGLGW